jgi:hypothetical protein
MLAALSVRLAFENSAPTAGWMRVPLETPLEQPSSLQTMAVYTLPSCCCWSLAPSFCRMTPLQLHSALPIQKHIEQIEAVICSLRLTNRNLLQKSTLWQMCAPHRNHHYFCYRCFSRSTRSTFAFRLPLAAAAAAAAAAGPK